MSNKLSIHGYACNRVFTYTEGEFHNELTTPGGAALIAQILSDRGLAEAVPSNDDFLQEHSELARYEGKNKRSYYAVGRRTGITPGLAKIDTVTASYALLWGTDFDKLPVSTKTPILWASNDGLPKKEQLQLVADHCFLMLDADVLRTAGAMISRQISWERTATELIWQIQNNPTLSYLLQAKHILVAFAEDGAVYITKKDEKLTAGLVLAHGDGEGSLRERLQGEIDDAFAVMTAAVAIQFEGVMMTAKEFHVLPILKSAEALMLSGYDIDKLKKCDFELFSGNEVEADIVYFIPIHAGQSKIDPDQWCISNSVSNTRIFDFAYDYVMYGEGAIDNLPRFSFGFLTTVDRWEIESYQNIRNLIVGYANGNSVRPLSIAVFGSPGSGKSFGVTQIAKNVLPGKVEKLEFNVSQITNFTELGAAFQKVRDVILEGKLPLVFFDEFDSDRDGLALGWIKSFLMPMQDGKFKDESGEHPLGKCILVFAGGTASSFEEFCKPMLIDKRTVKEYENFKNIKGPDFVSRLRGTINVLGPNQKDENDHNYILRRALLLRSLCERNEYLKGKMKKGEAPISPNILWAMLLVPKYKHGARSMEAILDMSRIEGNVWEPVSLPFYSQLELHVDAEAFIKLVLRDVILNSYVEQLAQAIHEDFVKEMTAAGNTKQSTVVPWDELTEEFKESNRAVARSYGEELNKVGFAYDAGDTPFPSVNEFDDKTLLILAQNQHIRYVNEKLMTGWAWGEKRDNKKKTNPTLVGWDELSEYEKKKDFDIVRNIIPLLESINLRVYKTI